MKIWLRRLTIVYLLNLPTVYAVDLDDPVPSPQPVAKPKLHQITDAQREVERLKKELAAERRKHSGQPDSSSSLQLPTETNAYGIRMKPISGGCFQMGSKQGDLNGIHQFHDIGGYSGIDGPPHQVCVDDFRLGQTEVTQGQWRVIMDFNPSHFSNCGKTCPVEQVSWDDVQSFIQRLNSKTGQHYRLPTEAEWEYACRSGGKAQTYCGGEQADALAWYRDNEGSETHPVAQKAPNGLGLYDMSGNVSEWTCKYFPIQT